MMNKILKNLGILCAAGVLMISYQNCQDSSGTETGDPSLHLQLAAYDPQSWLDHLIPKAYADVSAVKLCIHQIRFKADNSSGNPGVNANIEVGYIEWKSTGTDLGEVQVAAGDYERVDIMIKNECGKNLSVAVTNDQGTFSNSQPKILRFVGNITVDSDTEILNLGVEAFIDFFDAVTSDNDLGTGVETVEGDIL